MADKQIIYDCPHVSFTDWGTYACRLYDPRDKNCLVEGGNCDSNISCPYKQSRTKEQAIEKIKEIAEENDELLQGYQKEWANNRLILQKISECEVEDEKI